MNGRDYKFQVDTSSQDNFCDQTIWNELGRPKLHEPDFEYTGANDQQIKVMGKFTHPVKTDVAGKSQDGRVCGHKASSQSIGHSNSTPVAGQRWSSNTRDERYGG